MTATAGGAAGTVTGTSTACLQCAGAVDATAGAGEVPAAAEAEAGGMPAQTCSPDAGAAPALPGAPVAGDEILSDVCSLPRYCEPSVLEVGLHALMERGNVCNVIQSLRLCQQCRTEQKWATNQGQALTSRGMALDSGVGGLFSFCLMRTACVSACLLLWFDVRDHTEATQCKNNA